METITPKEAVEILDYITILVDTGKSIAPIEALNKLAGIAVLDPSFQPQKITSKERNFEFDMEKGGIKCLHTKEPCIVNDTVAGSTCSICSNNPKSELTLNNEICK